MTKAQTVRLHISKSQEGTYFTIPFSVPERTERIDIEYSYPRRQTAEEGGWSRSREVNVVDLAVEAPGGECAGSSGSNRTRVWISAGGSAEGFAPLPARAGTWAIVVGAYQIQTGGVDVVYTVTCTPKILRLLRGDTHLHTRGSDGALSAGEAAALARQSGLDYVFLTDHNNYAQNLLPPQAKDLTVLPGMEWTHYRGHCGMLGVRRPLRSPFCANTREQVLQKLREARAAGALLVLDHPFCPFCGWKFGFDVPFDLAEVWNGGTVPKANAECLAWWQSRLEAGERIPVSGGSDFHRPDLFHRIGSPCDCLYALSREPGDILAALKGGCGYLTYEPEGPGVSARAGDALLGGAAPKGTAVAATFFNLRGGDRLRVISGGKTEEVVCGPDAARYSLEFSAGDAGFCRFEVRRSYQPGLPEMTAMISNPIYFE